MLYALDAIRFRDANLVQVNVVLEEEKEQTGNKSRVTVSRKRL